MPVRSNSQRALLSAVKFTVRSSKSILIWNSNWDSVQLQERMSTSPRTVAHREKDISKIYLQHIKFIHKEKQILFLQK